MKAIKKIVAAAVAAVSIGAIGVTASAETVTSLPVSWTALYQHGAPTSINKKFSVTVGYSDTGYKAECTYFSGGEGSVVTLITSNGYSFEGNRRPVAVA